MATQKILIVDDSRTIRMQLKDMLPKGNFEVLEAKDGVEGFDLIQKERPNLVLLDFFMPRMNGWEVVQKIQTVPKLQSIPIVMMSGRREDVQKAVPELFDYFEFVGKPFEQRGLIRAIQSATSKAKQRYHMQQVEPPSALMENQPQGDRDQIQRLVIDIQQLQAENQTLFAELERLKQQMAQLVKFVQHRCP